MNVRIVSACVAMCVVSLLVVATASGQWSAPTQVGIVEGTNQGPSLRPTVSAARCGNSVVVGFRDTESNVNNSRDGYAVSADGGKTFRDLGVLPASTVDPGFGPDMLTGQVSLACGSSQLFYYASSLLADEDAPFCDPLCTAVSVSTSRDGGASWALPVVAASNFGDTHEITAPSIAVDPTSLPRIYVAYIDNNFAQPTDFFFPECDTSLGGPMELRLARSVDGGKTWTSGVIDHACITSSNPETQGVLESPNVVISPGGKVYLTYQFHQLTGTPTPGENEIRFTRSVNQGQTFSTPIVVSKDAIDNAGPQLAVDRTTSSFRGAIYLTWSGLRGAATEVLMADSLNQGVSFSFPRSVRATSVGTQVNPVVAVDNDGQVATCYYVTGTNTPTSTSSYFYNCLTSFNHAATWASYQKLVTSAPPGFDALTSDFLLQKDGFFTAFELPGSTTRKLVASTSDNGYSFKAVNFPGAASTEVHGINESGDLVGRYNNLAQSNKGFIKTASGFTSIALSADGTALYGINQYQQVVGIRFDFAEPPFGRGFLYHQGQVTDIYVAGSNDTLPYAINNQGEIVGSYNVGPNSTYHGFIKDASGYKTLDFPGAAYSYATGVSNAGAVVGIAVMNPTGSPCCSGYLYQGGAFSRIDFPGATATYAYGVNRQGTITGWYSNANFNAHGFVKTAAGFTTVDYPGSTSTQIQSINDSGQLVGYYTGGDCTAQPGFVCGFVATPVNNAP